jgi:hypothetical protein
MCAGTPDARWRPASTSPVEDGESGLNRAIIPVSVFFGAAD